MKSMIQFNGPIKPLVIGSLCVLSGADASGEKAVNNDEKKQNILLIIVDDLRPQLGCYGNTIAKTPNIDRFASEGTLFTRAICNYPVSGPSRASLMSGIRPANNRFLDNNSEVEREFPEMITMNTFFKNKGYATVAMGKVFHNRKDNLKGWTDGAWGPGDDDPKKSITGWRDYLTDENQDLCRISEVKAGKAYEIADVDDNEYYDGKVAERALHFLEDYNRKGTPFFMTLGFVKPHLPFNAPKKYWDIYPEDQLDLPSNYFFPEGAPDQARFNYPELRAYYGIPKEGPVPDDVAKTLIRGYYACTSYSDAMIGTVLEKLKELGLDKNTTVIIIGDHGWHLGEHTLWAKHSNFFNTLNTVMIIKAPGTLSENRVNRPTELVDIFPTVCEIAGYEPPAHLEGNSLVPLLTYDDASWKKAVFSKFENGRSVVTERYLYTEWKDESGKVVACMLYDHLKDPLENRNVSDQPAYRKTLKKLRYLLEKSYDN